MPWESVAGDAEGGSGADDRAGAEDCLRAGVTPAIVYSIENHPNDSRVRLDETGKVQTLTSRMGTGGGNVPMLMEPTPIQDQATRFSGKRGDKQDGKGNGLGVGDTDDPMFTLTSGDRHAVAYCMGNGQLNSMTMAEISNTLDCMHDQQAVVYGVDCRNLTESPELYLTVRLGLKGDQSLNYSGAVRVRYIVRRLTPTECARLQGFPDRWGHPDHKDDFTDGEYQFWLNVRNTHATINGKTVKPYTKAQMLTWYNKLHTDSSEYKMWGNGIALPNALYVMQGIADVFK